MRLTFVRVLNISLFDRLHNYENNFFNNEFENGSKHQTDENIKFMKIIKS